MSDGHALIIEKLDYRKMINIKTERYKIRRKTRMTTSKSSESLLPFVA